MYLVHSRAKWGPVDKLSTRHFLTGPKIAEEFEVTIEQGKTLHFKTLAQSDDLNANGEREVFFELNGQPRSVSVIDRTLEGTIQQRPKADVGNPRDIGAPMPGLIVTVAVKPGEVVKKGDKLLSLEAMKMETTVYAEQDGTLSEVLVSPGSPVEAGELIARYADN